MFIVKQTKKQKQILTQWMFYSMDLIYYEFDPTT